ncbi:hypothetical protein ACSBR2_030301 [Camellia fascicularis]
MMRIMCSDRGGSLFTTDDMYCVDNGAMIVYTGLLAYANGMSTPLEDSTFTQRFRTNEVLAIWRERKRNLHMVSWKKVSNYLHVSRASKYGVVIGNKEGVICQVKERTANCISAQCCTRGVDHSTELEPLQTGPTMAKDQVLDMKYVDLVGLAGLACLFKDGQLMLNIHIKFRTL